MKKGISIGLSTFVFGVGAAQASVPNEPGEYIADSQAVSKTEKAVSSITKSSPETILGACHVTPGRMSIICN